MKKIYSIDKVFINPKEQRFLVVGENIPAQIHVLEGILKNTE